MKNTSNTLVLDWEFKLLFYLYWPPLWAGGLHMESKFGPDPVRLSWGGKKLGKWTRGRTSTTGFGASWRALRGRAGGVGRGGVGGVYNTGVMLFLGALLCGFEEGKELCTLSFEACICIALAFPEGQKQWYGGGGVYFWTEDIEKRGWGITVQDITCWTTSVQTKLFLATSLCQHLKRIVWDFGRRMYLLVSCQNKWEDWNLFYLCKN